MGGILKAIAPIAGAASFIPGMQWLKPVSMIAGALGGMGGGDSQQAQPQEQPTNPLMGLAQTLGPAAAMNAISKQDYRLQENLMNNIFDRNKSATNDAIKQYQGYLGQYQDPTQNPNLTPFLQDPRQLAQMRAPHISSIGRGVHVPGLDYGGAPQGWSPPSFGGSTPNFGGYGGGYKPWSPSMPTQGAATPAPQPQPPAQLPPDQPQVSFPPNGGPGRAIRELQ